MWHRLLKLGSLREAFQPRLVQGRWHAPLINGRNKAKLRKQFIRAGVPWVFDQQHQKSPYDRVPKKIYKQFDNEERLLSIRAALKNSEAEIQKHREEQIKKKPYTGVDRMLEFVIPGMLKLQAGKKRKLSGGKKVEDGDESAILDFSEMKTTKRGKQNIGSRGGRVKSKSRSFMQETGSVLEGKLPGARDPN